VHPSALDGMLLEKQDNLIAKARRVKKSVKFKPVGWRKPGNQKM